MRFARLLPFALAIAVVWGSTAGAMPSPAPADPALTGLPAQIATDLFENDAKELRMRCAPSAMVVDEFAPYQWSGADACARWAAAFKVFAQQNKMTGFKATVAPNPFVDQSGSKAYMVAQVTFAGTMAGKAISEQGTRTFVAVKNGAAWKVTTLAWGTLHH